MKRGFSLLEVIIYSALGTVLMLAMSQSFISLNQAFREIRSEFLVNQAIVSVMQTLSSEIRSATSIDTVNSVLGPGGGRLYLNNINSNGTNTKKNFVLQNGVLYYQKDMDSPVSVSGSSILVKKFDAYALTSGHSYAVKIDIAFDYMKNGATTTENLGATYVLRGSY